LVEHGAVATGNRSTGISISRMLAIKNTLRYVTDNKSHLSRKAKAGGYSGHGGRHQMIEVAVCWCRQFESAETDVIQSLVVNAECFVCVLDKLVD